MGTKEEADVEGVEEGQIMGMSGIVCSMILMLLRDGSEHLWQIERAELEEILLALGRRIVEWGERKELGGCYLDSLRY